MTEAPSAPLADPAAIAQAAARPETRSAAIDLAITALGAGAETPLVVQLVSEGLEADGRLWDAAGLAQKVTQLAPDDPAAWIRLARLMRRLNLREEAEEAALKALATAPGSFEAHLACAAAAFALNRFEAAESHADQAAIGRPGAAQPLQMKAVVRARLGDLRAARALAEQALSIDGHLPGAQIVLARAELAERRPAAAASLLQSLLSRPDLPGRHRVEALALLGETRDATGEVPRAFAAFCASNRGAADEYRTVAGEAVRVMERARALEPFFSRCDPAPWREPAGEDRSAPAGLAGHVFLVGFPRSGTTLLESALAGHPRIVALEESDALARADADLLTDEAALARLASLTPEEADPRRDIYWARVAERVGKTLEGKVLLDKMPISILALPAIAKLFPAARVLLARRDPRDVVFGCFRRNFGVNPLLAEFHELEGTARFYDQVMRVASLYEQKLPIRPHVIRNEDVIADFDREMTAALRFAGLEFDPAVRKFSERGLRARTPSATQLASGLSRRGLGAWRSYARYMAPILPLLEPWAERFGYAPAGAALLPRPTDPALASARRDVAQAAAAGRWSEAFARTDQAFAAGLDDPFLHRFRGVRLQGEGRPAEAAAEFEQALGEEPGNVGLVSALGLCLARSGRPIEALDRLDEAIALAPDFAPAHFNRGYALEVAGDVRAAADAYHRAIAGDPEHAAAMGALASLAARRADWAHARAWAEKALARSPGVASALQALALAKAGEGQLEEAVAALGALARSRSAGPHEQAVAWGELGDLLDRLGRTEEAFAAYEQAAGGLMALHGPRFAASGKERALVTAGRLRAWFQTADARAWRRRPASAVPQPVFIVGFPRSGTTLLGQILAGHSRFRTLDEVDTLGEVTARFFADEAGLGQLAALDGEEAKRLAEAYWRRALGSSGALEGRLLVDKAPMNTLALPTISRLFPDAKVLFMRRDPRDVTLSCWRRRFGVNSTTVDLLSLEGAARLYDATMALFEIYRETLQLDLRIQRYESLVGDFRGEVEAICAWLGVEFEPAMEAFHTRAGEVSTPSAPQLAGGLASEGVGAWRRYRDRLAPFLPILAPWVERFGYSRA